MLLQGKSAIVTGGGQGLGKAVARRFLQEGAQVLIAGRRVEKLQATAQELGPLGRILTIGTDVSSAPQVNRMVDLAMREFGQIDILVNNAGGSGNVGVQQIEDLPEDLWDTIVNSNLKGTYLCCRAVVPHMKQRRYGKIVNFSSGTHRGTFGPVGIQGARLAYAAAKAGIHGFTYQLAKDLGPWNITVNVVVPGFTLTEEGAKVRERYKTLTPEQQAAMSKSGPLGRHCEPEEIASAVLFLASDESSYVTAMALDAGGGTMGRGPV